MDRIPISNKTDNRLGKFDYNNSMKLIQVGNFISSKKAKGVKRFVRTENHDLL